jgi:hypothetical protein
MSASLADSVRRVHEAGGGILDVYLVDTKCAARLLRDAMHGDAKAAQLFGAVIETGKRIADAPHRSPVLCVSCPRCIRRVELDLVFGIATPSTEQEPSAAIGFAICSRCAANRGAWMAKAEAGLRLIWPDLRPIIVTHPHGGRA